MNKISLILLLSCILILRSYGAVSDTYQEDDISVSFKRAYLKKPYPSSSEVVFHIDLKLKVLTKNKIVNPRTYYYSFQWRYADLQLFDNFGNNLGFKSISPRYQGKKTEEGLRPGEEKIFTLEFGNKPIESTNYLIIQVPKNVFGNINPFELKISNPVIEPLATKVASANVKTELEELGFLESAKNGKLEELSAKELEARE
ncbi:MAG: hypothetical protein JSW23_02775, partial [Planctomycetota bacterium]